MRGLVSEFLMVGRFVFGIGWGLYDVVNGLFMTEIAPISIRGLVPSLSRIPATLNAMFIMFLGLPTVFGKPDTWAFVLRAAHRNTALCCFPLHLLGFSKESQVPVHKRGKERGSPRGPDMLSGR